MDRHTLCTIFAKQINQMTQLEKDIRSYVVDNIKDYIGVYVGDLHHNLFNTNYWVMGYYNSEKEILKHGSVFDAIAKIKEYEESEFGECITDLSNSERVCNMLTYILGEECLNDVKAMNEHWDDDLTEEIANKIIAELV